MPTIPRETPLRRRACHVLGRQALAAIPPARAAAVLGLDQAEADKLLAELESYGMLRRTGERVILTEFGGMVGGVRVAEDGVRWVPAMVR